MIGRACEAALRLIDRPYGAMWPTEVDCSTLVAALLARVRPDVDWSSEALWMDLMIMDPERPWSDIEALTDATATGREVEAPRADSRVYVCQGWTGLRDGEVVLGSRGHTWATWELHGSQMVCEANGIHGGVGYVVRPWEDQVARWERVRCVRLRRRRTG